MILSVGVTVITEMMTMTMMMRQPGKGDLSRQRANEHADSKRLPQDARAAVTNYALIHSRVRGRRRRWGGGCQMKAE